MIYDTRQGKATSSRRTSEKLTSTREDTFQREMEVHARIVLKSPGRSNAVARCGDAQERPLLDMRTAVYHPFRLTHWRSCQTEEVARPSRIRRCAQLELEASYSPTFGLTKESTRNGSTTHGAVPNHGIQLV